MKFLKVRKRPIEVEAFQLTKELFDAYYAELELCKTIKDNMDCRTKYFSAYTSCIKDNYRMFIRTLEGDLYAGISDWIIKGVKGELYPCKDDIFRKTYDILED